MTRIKLTNNESVDVQTYITLGATAGCVQEVNDLIFSDSSITITRIAPLMCYFTHPKGLTTYVDAPEGLGFNGNVSFNTPPMNCTGSTIPEGMNLAEFIINNGFQGQNSQETIDNSCVAGANAQIRFTVSANDWATNGGTIQVRQIENKRWKENTGLVGVFPYGCDNCTSSDNPPSCVGKHPQYANSEPICNVQRNGVTNEGGDIDIALIKLY